MSEEISKILDKFDRTLEEYELDKKCGQISIDSIYHLFPSEIITIKDYIQQKENIIKEVREYIENNNLYEQDYTYDYEENIEEWPPDDTKARKELLEILDKEVN